ncbi:MAG: trehalose-phosphatase [Acidobacteriota bacterium]
MVKPRSTSPRETSQDRQQREALEQLASSVLAGRKRRGAVRPVDSPDDGLGSPDVDKRPAPRWGSTRVVWKEPPRPAAVPKRRVRNDRPPSKRGLHSSKPPLISERWEEVRERLEGRKLVFFLDYDGTLAWIAQRPELAKLPMAARITLERLAQRFSVHILSGRSRSDLQEMVQVGGCRYHGCHGFELDVEAPPQLSSLDLEALDDIERALASSLRGMRGVFFERKPFTLAVHYRLAESSLETKIRFAVHDLLPHFSGWSVEKGRCVFEIRPSVVWGKGEAIDYLLEGHTDEDVLPVAIGDDDTDESSFRALRDRGLTIHVDPYGRTSAAQYRVRNPTEVHSLLDRSMEQL